MIVNIPKTHPPIKGCLNTTHQDQPMKINFDNWETDEDGFIYAVDATFLLTDEDHQFVDEQTQLAYRNGVVPHSARAFLPVRIQKWFNDNVSGEWCYDSKASMRTLLIMQRNEVKYRFYFQLASDAVSFKLSWI